MQRSAPHYLPMRFWPYIRGHPTMQHDQIGRLTLSGFVSLCLTPVLPPLLFKSLPYSCVLTYRARYTRRLCRLAALAIIYDSAISGYLDIPGSAVVNTIWPNSPLIRRYPRQQHICPPQGYSVSEARDSYILLLEQVMCLEVETGGVRSNSINNWRTGYR